MSAVPGAAAPQTRADGEEREQRVTPLELFFDLVFVFAITQVTGFLSADASWIRLLEGAAILTVLWWAWECYAWLGNTAASDEGATRLALLTAMGAMLIASLAVPHAFGADALAFGAAYFAVRLLHIATYVILSRGDHDLRFATLRLACSMLPAATLLLLAGLVDPGTGRTVCWILAIAVDVAGLAAFGVKGWRVDAHHFAERHSLIVIIALGESIVALGVGAEGLDLDAGVIAGALLGVAVAAALWWAYFAVVVLVAERRFTRAVGVDRVRLARDSYTYLHLPMVAGIILFALGLKKTLGHVEDPLKAVPALALCGGPALYLLAHVAFRLRNVRRLNVARLIAAGVLLALIPVATQAAALLSLALVAVVAWAIIAYEAWRYAELRDRLRHAT